MLAPHSEAHAETYCVEGPVTALSMDTCVDDEIHPEPSVEAGGHAPKEASEVSSLYRLAIAASRSEVDGFCHDDNIQLKLQ